MNSDLINPFLQGAQNILKTVCGENPKLGKIFVKKSPYTCELVSIELGLEGDLNGVVVYTMKNEVACAIVSKMMFGMSISVLDDMSKSAISELGNMISGNIATLFYQIGKTVDITTPKFHFDAVESDFTFLNKNQTLICMPLSFQDGNIFEVDVFVGE